jgi:processive 1,2-diacylglycerol beta-glucosyltransferase
MKVLVTYVTAGAGHRMAAEALYEGLKEMTGARVVLCDALDHTSRFYKHFYSMSYSWVVTYWPWLWGALFRILDDPAIFPMVRLLRRWHNAFHARRLRQYLIREAFDVILTTHFFPGEVAGFLKKKGKIKAGVICCITDFDVHRIWLSRGVDRYTVACEWTAKKLIALGVDPSCMAATGIPVRARFTQSRDIPALKARLGLREGVFTVLVATGSFGMGPIEDLIRNLVQVQIMVVCGHNKELYQRLRPRADERVKVLGLVNNMDELMAAADVMITKPGGLSISEALVTGLPMIFFHAIPGQETHNIRVLGQYGVGVKARGIEEIRREVNRFQTQPASLQEARENIKTVARPSAVKDILLLTKSFSLDCL